MRSHSQRGVDLSSMRCFSKSGYEGPGSNSSHPPKLTPFHRGGLDTLVLEAQVSAHGLVSAVSPSAGQSVTGEFGSDGGTEGPDDGESHRQSPMDAKPCLKIE